MGAFADSFGEWDSNPDDANAEDSARPLDGDAPTSAGGAGDEAKPASKAKAPSFEAKLARAAGDPDAPPAEPLPMPTTAPEAPPKPSPVYESHAKATSAAPAAPSAPVKAPPASTVAKGPEAPGKVESATRGFLQGGTAGWGDELAAGVDTAVSKVPGLRTIAQMAHGDDLPPLTDPSVPYAARRDAYRGANQAAQVANPKTFGAGELAGTIGTAAALPAVGGLGGAVGVGAGVGALAGGGFSAAPVASEDFVRDVAKGAVVGGGTAAGAYGIGKYLLGAPVRAQAKQDAAILDKTTGETRGALLDKTGQVAPEIRELHTEVPALAKATKAGEHQKVIGLAEKHLNNQEAITDRIYSDYAAKANAAKAPAAGAPKPVNVEAPTASELPRLGSGSKLPPPSGTPAGAGPPPGAPANSHVINPKMVPETIPDALATASLKELKALRDHAAKPLSQGGAGADTAYVAKLDNIINRIGPGGKIDAKELRDFMTKQVGVKPGEASVAPRAADAQNDAYFVLRNKVLHPEIKRVLGPEAAAQLEKANALSNQWKRIKDAALQKSEKTVGKEAGKTVTSAPKRAVNAVGHAASDAAAAVTNSRMVQGLARGNQAVPGALPAVKNEPGAKKAGATESHPVGAALSLIRGGVHGTKAAYDWIFGPRAGAAAGSGGL